MIKHFFLFKALQSCICQNDFCIRDSFRLVFKSENLEVSSIMAAMRCGIDIYKLKRVIFGIFFLLHILIYY
jgi:hypothetical protein